jgi:hypothetical protein
MFPASGVVLQMMPHLCLPVKEELHPGLPSPASNFLQPAL